ncbi:hypothetical protein Nepgr_027241 [Nepenthes gracilis]|uniref:Uncharacterized protein n=1 Tax=Nepenthes gracilis TaxID=150966 RepID=A0AAD3T8K3_NEPGR|nr:hypothetical protein Nepgr_027241 [Nepenthes gracilis]
MVPSDASALTPAGVGISGLPSVSSRPPTSRTATGSPLLGFLADPYPPLKRGATLPAQGPDAEFLARSPPAGLFQENSAFDILGAEASTASAALDFGVAPVDAVRASPSSISSALQVSFVGSLKDSWLSVVKQGKPGGIPGSDSLIPRMLDGSPPLKFYHPDKIEDGVASITPPIDVLTQGENASNMKEPAGNLQGILAPTAYGQQAQHKNIRPAAKVPQLHATAARKHSSSSSKTLPSVAALLQLAISKMHYNRQPLNHTNGSTHWPSRSTKYAVPGVGFKHGNEVRYQWKPIKCRVCRKFGHATSQCNTSTKSSKVKLCSKKLEDLLPTPSIGDTPVGKLKAPSVKVVRFAPEIISSATPNCASRYRKIAPCSDIHHPIVFRRSNLGLKDSMVDPVDAVPKVASSPLAPPVDTPADDVAPSTYGSSNRGVAKGLVCRLLVDSQTPLDDAVSSIVALPIPGFCRVLSGPVSLSLSQGRLFRNHDGLRPIWHCCHGTSIAAFILRHGIVIPIQDLRLGWPADVDFYSSLDLWLSWIY